MKEDAGAVRSKGGLLFVEIPLGKLLRGRLGIAGCRHVDDPDVTLVLGIEVALPIEAIYGPRDYLDVTLVFGFSRRLFLLLLCQVFGIGVAEKCDSFAIWRPHRIANTAGQIGDDPGFTAGQRKQRELRRHGFAVLGWFATAAHEGDPPTVGRPTRLGVTLAIREAYRGVRSCRWNHPERRVVVVFLLVDGHAHKGNVRAIGGNFGIANPLKAKQVLVGDRALGLSETGKSQYKQGSDSSDTTH